MSGDSTVLSELQTALRTRGFAYTGRSTNGWPQFTGYLLAAGTQHAATVSVDLTGQELPHVKVELPSGAPSVLAHVGANGFVCYAAKGSLVLDVFDIPGQIVACIERASLVLDLSLRGEFEQDLEDEFFTFWGGEPCFLDIDGSNSQTLTVLHFEEARLAVISSNPGQTQKKLQALRLNGATEMPEVASIHVSTTAKPRPMQGTWPPRTVAHLLEWQSLLDRDARNVLQRKLLKASAQRKLLALCVVSSPVFQYVFWVRLAGQKSISPAKALTTALPRLLTARIFPMTAFRIDDRYICGRNSPRSPTLAGRRIALVGCGTIGGFLAELLVKAGAGLDGGELLLVDPDILAPQNVGRHRLGIDHALKKKATALKVELCTGAPTANLRDFPVRVQEMELGKLDLLIDATGEEAVGTMLTRRFADQQSFVPTLSVWVEGPGVAVRGLLRDELPGACTRCLCANHGHQLFPVVKGDMPDEMAGHGCESLYVPFPATVSVQAACLAAEMVSDWLSGMPGERLRTRVTRRGFEKGTEDADVPRREGCPACST